MAEPLLQVQGLSKRFGGIVASDALSLAVAPGELHAVIGPNGAGKTTLIAQLTGQLAPDDGTIRFAGQDITTLAMFRRSLLGLARSFQITSLFLDLSVLATSHSRCRRMPDIRFISGKMRGAIRRYAIRRARRSSVLGLKRAPICRPPP